MSIDVIISTDATNPSPETGTCVICTTETADRMPCTNCKNEFCCDNCIRTTVATSSVICRTGLCFLCRDQYLEVPRHPPLLGSNVEDHYIPEEDAIKILFSTLCFIVYFCLIVFALYIAGGTAVFIYDGAAKNYTNYLFGYPENDKLDVLSNFFTGMFMLVVLVIFVSCCKSNRVYLQ